MFAVRIMVVCVILLCSLTARTQQCTLPSRIFVPTANEARGEGLGQRIDVDGDYMVAAVPFNSSQQVYSGVVLVYKLDPNDLWVKIAELSPSDPGKYREFGTDVAISGNSIVVKGREFNDEGWDRNKLYFFEKPAAGDWISATENYVVAQNFTTASAWSRIHKFDLRGNELVVVGVNDDQEQLQVYKKSAGAYALSQTINTPVDGTGRTPFLWELTVADDFVAIASNQFDNADNSIGAAFVYEKIAGNYKTIPTHLSTSRVPTEYTMFGSGLASNNSTLFVAGSRAPNTVPSVYTTTFYAFEKPAGGWVDQKKTFTFEAPGGTTFMSYEMTATDDFLFGTGSDFGSVIGFKKASGGWSSSASGFIIDDLPANESSIGYQLKVSNEHLIIGCPGRFLWTGQSQDFVADYYQPDGEWDNPAMVCHQKLTVVHKNATDDFFGASFGVYDDCLAISASGDDDQGSDTGVVYVFNTLGQNAAPDQKLYCPEIENFTGFGESIAVGDSVMFVSAPYKDSLRANNTVAMFNIGKVYIYRLTSAGWRYASQIIAPKVEAQTSFGRTVVWSRGYVAVTEFYSGDSERVGRVHIYKENAAGKFLYLATLDPAQHQPFDFFGSSIAMTDSIMVIGTGTIAPSVADRRSAYVFRKKGEWKNATEDARLSASDTGWADRFGASVSMHGDYIVVGAPNHPGFDPRPIPRAYIIPGAAYIFKKPAGGWKGHLTEIAKLSPRDPTELGAFGASVAIDHNDIFVGSPNVYNQYNNAGYFTNNDNTLIPGKVYHYKKPAGDWVTTSQESVKLESFEPDIVDGYGAVVYVSDRYLYVGAMLDNTEAGFRTGSVQTMMQLPVIDSPPPLCDSGVPVKLAGFPRQGTWAGPGITAQKTFDPSVAGAGIHTLDYNVYGCETSTSIIVLKDALVVTDQSDPLQEKCIGAKVSLLYSTNEDAARYKWYFRETSATAFKAIDSLKEMVSVVNPGHYRAKVDREVCADLLVDFAVVDEDPVEIKIEPLPVVCDVAPVELMADPETGTWSGAGISPQGNINPADLANGVYREVYQVVTELGCTWKDSISVHIDILKQPTLLYNGEPICGQRPVTLTVANVEAGSTVAWFDAGMNEISTQGGLTIQVNEPGTYNASVSRHTCNMMTSPVTVEVLTDTLFVPNVFSPNGDGLNDLFEVRAEGIQRFNISVFNRYGKPEFESNDVAFKWPAYDVPSGVYFWRTSYMNCNGIPRELKGWVHLVR